jgi:Arc-like DNA binding domain
MKKVFFDEGAIQGMRTELKLRLPVHWRQRIEKAAHKRGVSINQELLDRVTQSFEREDIRTVIEETAKAVVNRMK